MQIKHTVMLSAVLALFILVANGILVHLFHADLVWQKFASICSVILILAIVCTLIKLAEKWYIEKIPKTAPNRVFAATGVKALSRLFQVMAVVLFILIILGILDIPISALLTVGGVGGIALAYAAKDVLTNSIGGLMIYVNHQFVIGETIHSPDRDIAGVVEEMGWRFTTIRRQTGEVMYVPNSVFSDILLINVSRKLQQASSFE